MAIKNKILIVFFCFVVKPSKRLTINKTITWYIWYLTAVSKLLSCSNDNISFKACAPKAPKIIAVNPKKQVIIKFLKIYFGFFLILNNYSIFVILQKYVNPYEKHFDYWCR